MNTEININDLTQEQKVVLRLAEMGIITSAGDIQRALKEFQYANYLISPINDDGTLHFVDINNDGIADEDPSRKDIIESAPGIDCEGECDVDCEHEPVSHKDIIELFDDDPTNDGEG